MRRKVHHSGEMGASALRDGLRQRGIGESGDRAEAEHQAMLEWQARWDTTDKGAWTHRFIPSVDRWKERGHGSLHFHLTQALTGHGCFRAYLKRIGKLDDDMCPTCRRQETVEHAVLHCNRMEDLRRQLEEEVPGPITPERLGEHMLSSLRGWTTVDRYLTAVVKRLEEAERARNRAQE